MFSIPKCFTLFQFLNGSINIGETTASQEALQGFQFLNGSINIIVLGWFAGVVVVVSIPQWFD